MENYKASFLWSLKFTIYFLIVLGAAGLFFAFAVCRQNFDGECELSPFLKGIFLTTNMFASLIAMVGMIPFLAGLGAAEKSTNWPARIFWVLFGAALAGVVWVGLLVVGAVFIEGISL